MNLGKESEKQELKSGLEDNLIEDVNPCPPCLIGKMKEMSILAQMMMGI